MQTSLRQRLSELVQQRWGRIESGSIRELAADAGVAYTTLARFLLYDGERATHSLRRDTIVSVALALDVNPNWLAEGRGSRQLGLWPVLVDGQDVEARDPVDELVSALQEVRDLPEELKLRACRAALASMLDVVVSRGGRVTGPLYNHLIRLDAQHRYTGDRASAG